MDTRGSISVKHFPGNEWFFQEWEDSRVALSAIESPSAGHVLVHRTIHVGNGHKPWVFTNFLSFKEKFKCRNQPRHCLNHGIDIVECFPVGFIRQKAIDMGVLCIDPGVGLLSGGV